MPALARRPSSHYLDPMFVRTKRWPEPAFAPWRTADQFTPENSTKTYFEWMYNIRDWCISRQLWWGHRHPGLALPGLRHGFWWCANARQCPCGSSRLEQDPDVLDTWSARPVPFSTLGWPRKPKTCGSTIPPRD